MIEKEKLARMKELIKEYCEKYPDEPNPIHQAGGIIFPDEMLAIFKEAKGRRIRFIWEGKHPSTYSRVEFF